MNFITLNNKIMGKSLSTFIIAEAGVNHNGKIQLAKKLVDAAKKFKTDAIKFQTFKTEELLIEKAEKADYQEDNTQEKSQYEMLKNLELSSDEFQEIADYTLKKDIIFISSPFDKESANLLDDLGVPIFKIASGEITNFPLLKHIAKKEKPVILSTGMSTLGEIEEAINLIEKYNNHLILMHCVTSYPARIEDTNLNVIKTLKSTFKKPVGFSDHSLGIEMSIAAVTLGSSVIEKHFTLDKNLPGPDHKASLEPDEFANMVKSIRNVEKGLGNGIKKPTVAENKIKKVARKSVVAKIDIPKNTILTEDMLAIKRPGSGIEPKYYNHLISKQTTTDIKRNTLIKWNQLK